MRFNLGGEILNTTQPVVSAPLRAPFVCPPFHCWRLNNYKPAKKRAINENDRGKTNETAESGERRRQIGVLKYDKTKRRQKEKSAIAHVRALIWKYSSDVFKICQFGVCVYSLIKHIKPSWKRRDKIHRPPKKKHILSIHNGNFTRQCED